MEGLLDHLQQIWEGARMDDPADPATRWLIQFRLSGGSSPSGGGCRTPRTWPPWNGRLRPSWTQWDVSFRTGGVGPVVDLRRGGGAGGCPGGGASALLGRLHAGEPVLDVAEEELAGYDPERDGSVHAYIQRLMGGMDRELVARLRMDGDTT